MNINDIAYIPQNDIGVNDLAIVKEHHDKIDENLYDDATALLNDNNFNKGFRASFFNTIQNGIKTLQTHLLDEATDKSFDVSFDNTKELVEYDNAYYMTLDTYGDNWKVSDETTPSTLVFNEGRNKLRLFYSDYTFFRAMNQQKDYVFEFTAPEEGTYELSVWLFLATSGGYADIYVNDVKVGTVDTYNTYEKASTVTLERVYLESGEFANKIKIFPSGKSQGTSDYPSFIKFSFTHTKEEKGFWLRPY